MDTIKVTRLDGIFVSNYDYNCKSNKLVTLLNREKLKTDLLLLPSPYCHVSECETLLKQYKHIRDILPDPTSQYEFSIEECPSCFRFAFQGAGPCIVLATERKRQETDSKSDEKPTQRTDCGKNVKALSLASQRFQNRPCNILVRIDDQKKKGCAFLSGNVPANIVLEHLPPNVHVSLFQVPGSGTVASNTHFVPKWAPVNEAHSMTYINEGFVRFCVNPSQILRALDSHGVSDMYTVIHSENNSQYEALVHESYKHYYTIKHATHIEDQQGEMETENPFENKHFDKFLKSAMTSRCKSLLFCDTADECTLCFEGLNPQDGMIILIPGRPDMQVVSGLLKLITNGNAKLILMNTISLNIPLLGEINLQETTKCKDAQTSSIGDVEASPNIATVPSCNANPPNKVGQEKTIQFSEPPEEKVHYCLPNAMCTTILVPRKQAVEQRISLEAKSNSPFLKLRTSENFDRTVLCEVNLDTLLKQRETVLTSFVAQPNVWTNIPPASKVPTDYHKCKGKGVSLSRYFKDILGPNSQLKNKSDVKVKVKKLGHVLVYLLGPLIASQLDPCNVINLIHKDQEHRVKLAALLKMILDWNVDEGFDSYLNSETQFHLTPTHSSAHAASLVVSKPTSTFTYNNERVIGALIIVDKAKSKDLQVFVQKLKWQHPSAPDLALKLNFKLEGSCGMTLAHYLYMRGCIRKKIDIIREFQLTIGETLSLVLNPQRAFQILQSFPLELSQCVAQIPFDHALSVIHMQFLEEDRFVQETCWELIEAFIKTAKQQSSIPIVVSTSAASFHTIELTCKKAFSLQIKRGYKFIDRGVEIVDEYTYNDHSGKLMSTAQFTLESLPEMTLFPSLKMSTFTDILFAFDLPSPGSYASELKIPLLDMPLSKIKSFDSPALTLTQVSQHQPEMVVSKLSCNVRGILEKKVLGSEQIAGIYHYLVDQKYIPDVFGRLEERFKPCVAILNPYGKTPEIQLAIYLAAEYSISSYTLNLDMTLSASKVVDSQHTNKYTIIITNPCSSVDHSQWLVIGDLLAHFGYHFSTLLPSCVTDILTKIEIRRVQLSFSAKEKKLQEFELFCSIKAFDLMKGTISSKAIFIYLSYSRGKKVHIQCKGLLSLLGSEWFPLNFSLPTMDKPANVSIDNFVHKLSLSSLLQSSLWATMDHESKPPLLNILPPDMEDLLKDLKMFDMSLLSLHLEINKTSGGESLWVSKAMISLSVIEHLSLNGLIELDNVTTTIEVSKQSPDPSDCYCLKMELEATVLKCLHVTLSYDNHSHCLKGELSAISRNTEKATALYAINNIGAGNENHSTYNTFGDWSKEITTLVTKYMQESETSDLFDSLKLSHAEIVIRHTGGMNFVLDYLSIHIIDLLKDPHKCFEVTDLQFEYITLEGSQVVATENYQPAESKDTKVQDNQTQEAGPVESTQGEDGVNQETLQIKETVVQKTTQMNATQTTQASDTQTKKVTIISEKRFDQEGKENDTQGEESQNQAQDTNTHGSQDQTKDVQTNTTAVLTAIVSVADTKLKIIFGLASNASKSAHSKKELTCQILPINEADPLSLMSLIEIARCNVPELPDIEMPTNIFDLRVNKGSLTIGFSPFRIKRFDVLLSTAPNWVIYESPHVELENLVFHIIYDSERKENSCQVEFDCNLTVASTSLSIEGSLSKEHVKASIRASYESETGTTEFQDVLKQWPPSPGKAYRVPTDINLPNLSFTLGHFSLDILLEKEFKQVKLEALIFNKWSVDFTGKNDHTSKQVELEFCALGGFLNFQSSKKSNPPTQTYFALLFGKLQLHDVTLAGQMLLGSEKCNITAYICREELGHKLSFPGIANEFVTETNFTEMAPKSLVDKLIPTVALLHVDVKAKRLLVCAELKDFARGILYLEYRHCDESKKKKKVYCTMVLTLDENFKFTHISGTLQFVDNAVTIKHARLMITSEDRPFTNVLKDMTTASKDSCKDYKLYDSSTVATRTPLPLKVSEAQSKCTHVRSLMTDKLVKDLGQPFTLWPFEQDRSSFTDTLQSGFCIYAAFNLKYAEKRSSLIRNVRIMATKPDLRETQLVVVAKCSNITDKSKAVVSFKGHLNEIELSGCLLLKSIQVSFDVTFKKLQHLLLEGTLLVQLSDEKFKFDSLSFFGRLEICDNKATFEAKAELKGSTIPFGQFGIDPGNSGSTSIASLRITVRYEKKAEDKHFPAPFVTISGYTERLFGFLKTQADIVLKGTTFKLFRLYIDTSADFEKILKAQMCNDISLDPGVIVIHTGELYYSRCSESEYQVLPNVYGNPKSYRRGLWMDCDVSLMEHRFLFEVCFPVSGNKFDIRGGKKDKIKLFGFLTLTNDTFFSGPQLKMAKRGSTVELTLIIGVELWGDPWFVGTLSLKNKVGNVIKSPGFEAGIECKKTLFGWKPPKVVIGWSIASGFEILGLPLKGALTTLMTLSTFLNQWQNVARLAYSLIMSSVKVSVDGKFRMETSRDKVPVDCCCMFVWSGDLLITVIGFIEIPIALPEIPLAIRRYDPSRHSGLISYLFDCLWTNTKLIAKSIWNYLSLKNLFNVVKRAAVETVKRTVKKVVNVVKSIGRGIGRFFGIGRGNSFWVLDVNNMPIAYCEHHDSDSPFALLFGRPLAMKAIQEVAAIILSNARATNELEYDDDSQGISPEELNSFEKYIHELGYKAAKQSDKVLKIECVEIDVENKRIKWKMSKLETELDIHDPTYHIKVVGTVVLKTTLEESVTIFETNSEGIKMGPHLGETSQNIKTDSSKDDTSSQEVKTESSTEELDFHDIKKSTPEENLNLKFADGWLTLDLCKMNPQAWDNCVCIAVSVYASVSNKVTVLPSGISDEESSQSEHERKEQTKEEEKKRMEKDIREKGWTNEVHIRGRCCYTEKLTKQSQIPSLPISFTDYIRFAASENQIVGNVEFPSSSSCIVQLYNTEDCTDILWQKLLKSNNFLICVRELPCGSSCGPFKLRALIVSSDNSLQSEFVSSEFEISRCNSPQCIRQATQNFMNTQTCTSDTTETVISEHIVQDKAQSDVVFSWKEPGYLQQNFEGSEEQPIEPQQVDYMYSFSGKLKEVVLFDGSTRECEFQCQLKDLFEKHSVPLSESVNLSFEVVTLGDTEKLDSIPSVTEFIVLSPPTDMEISPPSEDFGVHLQWNFAANAMSYLIKLVNTSTGISKISRNHIPEQKLGKQYLKGTKGNERYEFHSRDFESNENDDVFIVHTEEDESVDFEEETEECTDTLALLNYADLKQFLQMEPATYKIEMFSSGDGNKCIQSLTSLESSNEEKIEILSSEIVHLHFDYKTENFFVDVQSNEVFAKGHVVELVMETKDEQTTSNEFLANCVVGPNDKDSTIHTVIKEWRTSALHQGSKIVCAVSSVCPNVHKGVSCTLAKSSNALEVISPPSNVTFSVPSTLNKKIIAKTTDTSPDSSGTSSEVPKPAHSTNLPAADSKSEIITVRQRPFPFNIVLNVIDDLIVSHSSGDIITSCETKDTDHDGAEFFVGFASKTNLDVILFKTSSSNRNTFIDLDKLCFDTSTTCQLFVQLAGYKRNYVTSSFALCDHIFHCLKAEVRVNRQWDFKTIQVVYPTISLLRILFASVFRNSIIPLETPLDVSEHLEKQFESSSVGFDKAISKRKQGYSTRFQIATKLARKLKCRYAFVYQYDSILHTSEQYEYSVCQSSVRTSKNNEAITTTSASVSVPPFLELTPEQKPPVQNEVNTHSRNADTGPRETSVDAPKDTSKSIEASSQASKKPVSEVNTQVETKQKGKQLAKNEEKKDVTAKNKTTNKPKHDTKTRQGSTKDTKVTSQSSSQQRKAKVQSQPKNDDKGTSQPRGQSKGKPAAKDQTQEQSKKVTTESHTPHHLPCKDATNQPTKIADNQPEQSPDESQRDNLAGPALTDSIKSPEHAEPVVFTESDNKHKKTQDLAESPPTLSERETDLDKQINNASDHSSADWVLVQTPVNTKASDHGPDTKKNVARTCGIGATLRSRELWFILLSGKEPIKKQKGTVTVSKYCIIEIDLLLLVIIICKEQS